MSELNVVSGNVALDLVNTVEPRVPGRTDGNEHLRSADDLLAWGLRVGVLSEDEGGQVRRSWSSGGQHADVLAFTLELREAIYQVMLSELGTLTEVESAGELLIQHWADAAGRSRLAVAPAQTGRDRLQVGTDPAWLIPDRLAQAAMDLLRQLDVRHLKTCPLDQGGCGWLFLDQSRNGSRRWCSMADCGGRAKARRLTDRRRTARVSNEPKS